MNTDNASLSELRHKSGLSQEEVAYRLGISRSYYNALECGRRAPGKWLQQSIQVVLEELTRLARTNVNIVHTPKDTQPVHRAEETNELMHPAGKKDILDHLQPWLECVDQNPNVAPYVLTQLRKYLPHTDLSLFLKKPE